MVSPEEVWRAGSGASGRLIRFLTSPQRLQVARANTLLPQEKRTFFLQRVAFHLRPNGAVGHRHQRAPRGHGAAEGQSSRTVELE